MLCFFLYDRYPALLPVYVFDLEVDHITCPEAKAQAQHQHGGITQFDTGTASCPVCIDALHFIIGQDHRHRHRFRSAGREHGIEFLFLSKDARFYIPQELVCDMQRNDAEGSRGADRSVAAPCKQACPVGNEKDTEKIYGDYVSCGNLTAYAFRRAERKQAARKAGLMKDETGAQ